MASVDEGEAWCLPGQSRRRTVTIVVPSTYATTSSAVGVRQKSALHSPSKIANGNLIMYLAVGCKHRGGRGNKFDRSALGRYTGDSDRPVFIYVHEISLRGILRYASHTGNMIQRECHRVGPAAAPRLCTVVVGVRRSNLTALAIRYRYQHRSCKTSTALQNGTAVNNASNVSSYHNSRYPGGPSGAVL